MSGQLDLFDPPAEGWWEFSGGGSTVFVLADTELEAREKAEAELRDLGVVPGGPPVCTRASSGCASSRSAVAAELAGAIRPVLIDASAVGWS